MLRSQLSIGTSNTLLVFLTFLTISRAVQHFLFALSWDVPARTKTDSETPPDSETRDSETARRIQKLHVGLFRNYFAGFRNYIVGFRNYFVGFRNYSWYSETTSPDSETIRGIQKLIFSDSETISWDSENTRGIQKLLVHGIQKLFSSDSETTRGIQKLFSSGSETIFVGFRNYSWYSETIFVGIRNSWLNCH